MSVGSHSAPGRADELKRALVAIRDLRRRVRELESRPAEPIAIIGMACRFPGGADTPERFWELLRSGTDATCETPPERWDVDALYDPNPDAQGKVYARRGGFLREAVDRFDPGFFGISPREAAAMDPVQRLLLELAWEALERAGLPPRKLDGTETGVFVGLSTSDYDILQRNSGVDEIHSYRGTGTLSSVATGRISHFLGLQGPNFPVDTACSSGLVALVLAVDHLRASRCSVALTGSANLMLAPDGSLFLSRMRALSPNGRCHTFDATAAGYARAEGGGVFVLKRLSDAQADGDPVLAVIRGAASNHDGRSSGITVPNPAAQRAVIRAALRNAGLEPSAVSYVEAHGTATPLGDPIELRALAEVLCRERTNNDPLWVGSAKTNLGHLEPSAGIAGLMKVVLALQHGQIPPHLNFTQPTPHVDWEQLALRVPRELTPWDSGRTPRVAGVSAFGFSGTNAHVIVEEAPPTPEPTSRQVRPMEIVAVSGRSRSAVRQLAGRYREHLATGDRDTLADLAVTSTAGRNHHSFRATALGSTTEEIRASLGELENADDATVAQLKPGSAGPVAFLFTGQGSQYPGMARELYESSPTFRAQLECCEEILRPHLDRPLLPLLLDHSAGDALQQTAYAQPALFALEYSLAELWRSWGIEPSYVVGHSLGEYVAATIAGVVRLEDALPLVVLRGRLMQELPSGGRMAAVFAPEARVRDAIQTVNSVAVAALNAPENVVISGNGAAFAEVLRRLGAEGIGFRELKVSHAFHSPAMDPILDAFEHAVQAIDLKPPRLGLISNLTGELLTNVDATDPHRWRKHIREPVQFAASVRTLGALGVRTFLEIGPHSTLAAMGMATLPDQRLNWLPSLRRGMPAWKRLAESVAALYRAGHELDWAGWTGNHAGRRVSVPTYPFQRQRYWFSDHAAATATAPRQVGGSASGPAARHPLLGASLQSPGLEGWAFQTVLASSAPVYLADHRVQDQVLVPGAAFVEMMLAAAKEGPDWPESSLRDLHFERPLILPEEDAVTCQVLIGQPRDGTATARVVSAVRDGEHLRWTTHATATLRRGDAVLPKGDLLHQLRSEMERPMELPTLYAKIEARGIAYGPSFRTLVEAWTGPRGALGRVLLSPAAAGRDGYYVHPCLLDAGFQLLAGLTADSDDPTVTAVPAGIDEFVVAGGSGNACWIYATLREQSDDQIIADLMLLDDDGRVFGEVRGFRARRAVGSLTRSPAGSDTAHQHSFFVDWHECDAPAEPTPDLSGTWIILEDAGGIGRSVADALRASGGRAIHILRGSAWARTGDDDFIVDPKEANFWPQLLAAAELGPDTGRVRGVFHFWSLDAEATESTASSRALDTCMPLVGLLRMDVTGETPEILRLVTQGAVSPNSGTPRGWGEGSVLWGLHSVVQSEHPEIGCRVVDLDPDAATYDSTVLLRLLLGDCAEDRIAHRGSRTLAPRLVAANAPQAGQGDHRPVPDGDAYRIAIKEPGTLGALHYEPAERVAPGRGQVEVRVRATGLNFRDVLNALGTYPGEPSQLGVEFGGLVVRVGEGVQSLAPGDEVIGLAEGAFASHVTVPAAAIAPVPRGMPMEQAVTIPLAFLTAEWGLVRLAGLRTGERVLIHAAAGGVGQAAVQIAQAIGAEVFATAGSDEKRHFLRSQGVLHVFDSRSSAFANDVLRVTGGEGVDVVLNSLTGELLHRGLQILRPGGRFLEIGKAELLSEQEVSERYPSVRYATFDTGMVLVEHPETFQALFRSLIGRFEQGQLRPLRVRSYPAEEVVDAFRFMAQARHIGKLVVTAARPVLPSGRPIRADGAYLVTGATGGIGRGLVEWLLRSGAGAVVLNARSAPSEEVTTWMETLRRTSSARLVWASGDIARPVDAERVIGQAVGTGLPLRGVFHAAGVLDDGLLMEQSRERFDRVLSPKVAGAWNLHALTRSFDLDHFVLFSSVASLLSGPGQGAYAAANAYMGALAERRALEGLTTLCIDGGAWGGQGMAGRLSDRERPVLEERGMGFLSPARAIAILEQLLEGRHSRVVAADVHWPAVAISAHQVPPLLRTMMNDAAPPRGSAGKLPLAISALSVAQLSDLTLGDRRERLTAYLGQTLSRLLGMGSAEFDTEADLTSLGFDSLMAVELRNQIETDLGIRIPVSQLLGSATPENLAGDLADRLGHQVPAVVGSGGEDAWVEGEI